MIRTTALLLSALGLLVAGGPVECAWAAPQDAPITRLIDGGRGEKREVRFRPTVGAQRTESFTLQVDEEIISGGKAEPPTTLRHVIRLTSTVTSVSREGDARYEIIFGKPEADERSPALKALEGVTGHITLTDRGMVKEQDFQVPEGGDERTLRVVEALKRVMSETSAGFPEEPIAVGARWEVKQSARAMGMTIQNTAVFKVTSFDQDGLSVHADLTQSAAPQELKPRNAPPTAKFYLLSLSGSGTADMSWDLAWGNGASNGAIEVRTQLKGWAEVDGTRVETSGTGGVSMNLRAAPYDPAKARIRKGGVSPTRTASPATRIIDPWEGQKKGSWYRIQTTTPDGDGFTDTGFKGHEGSSNLLVTQHFLKGGAGSEEDLRVEVAPVKISGEATLQVQGRGYLCEIREPAPGEKTWAIKEGRHAGATLRSESSRGVQMAHKLWEHTLKIKGREFDCLVVEAELKSGETAEGIKTWFTSAVPTGAVRVEREGTSTNLVDFGPDWTRRPPPPGVSAPGK